jgi:hypothetical protein
MRTGNARYSADQVDGREQSDPFGTASQDGIAGNRTDGRNRAERRDAPGGVPSDGYTRRRRTR